MRVKRADPGSQRGQFWWERGVRAYVRPDAIHLVRVTRNGYPIAAERVCTVGCDRVEARALLEGEADLMLKKKAELRVMGVEKTNLFDPMAQQKWPGLWEHMTALTFPDGDAREPSSMTIFMQEGMLKAMLRDKANGLCLWVASKSLVGLFDALEGGIDDPETDWRVDRAQPGQSAKRTRK